MYDGTRSWTECIACGGRAYHNASIPVRCAEWRRGWRLGKWITTRYLPVTGNEAAAGVLCPACLDLLPKRTINVERGVKARAAAQRQSA